MEKIDVVSIPDAYLGWAAMFAVLFMRTFVHGVIHSYGMFLVYLSKEFADSRVAILGWIGSMCYGVVEGGTPFALFLSRMIGPRKTIFAGVLVASAGLAISGTSDSPYELFFTYSLLTGCGMLFVNKPGFFLLDAYFPPENKHHVLATSLPKWSNSLGSLIFNPMSEAFLSAIGWQMTFTVYGILLFFLGCAGVYCLREKPQNAEANTPEETLEKMEKEEDCSNSKLALSVGYPVFVCGGLYFAAMFTWAFAIYAPTFILVKHLTSLDIPVGEAAIVITLYSTADLCGRALITFVGDKFAKGRLLYVYIVCCLALALENFIAGFGTSVPAMITFALTAGFSSGLMGAVIFPVTSEVLDKHYTHELFALSGLATGTGVISGIFLTGVIFDISDSYQAVFLMNLGVYSLAAFLFYSIIRVRNTFVRAAKPVDGEQLPLMVHSHKMEIPASSHKMEIPASSTST